MPVIIFRTPIGYPEACLSKGQKCFCTRKAIAKSQPYDYRAVLFTYLNRGSLQARGFGHIRLSVFRYRLIKNGFVGPKSFRGFAEMCP